MRVAIDTGGTFTDCVYLDAGALRVLKLFSTPADPSLAVLDALRRIAGVEPVDVRHGTTVGTNTMLERKGARVAFVTTAGFEDTIAIGRQTRATLYDWFAPVPQPLVPRELRFGVPERVSAEGEMLRAPSEEELASLVEQVRASGAEAVAISLLFSFARPETELRVEAALSCLGIPVSTSHRILPEFREYERASTTVVNACLAPRMQSYLTHLEERVSARHIGGRVDVMQSSGGIIPARLAAREPVRTVLSGPAGGVIGACQVARWAGFERVIGFDMGGTSTDVFLAEAATGGARLSRDSVVAGVPIGVPMLDIHTAGAGGGSIARFDAGGMLRVGPESAGADPGPVCFGRGELPTVTDANFLLGRLDAESFLGGGVKLDRQRTERIMRRHKGPIESVEEFAAGILRVVETNMERAIRVVSVERGNDPRDFALVAFGGGGPLHACAVARALRIPTVLVPAMPGALSALGILLADAVRDYSRTVMLPGESIGSLDEAFAELGQRASADFDEQGLRGTAHRSLDIRYRGQGHELNVPCAFDTPSNSIDAFHRLHRQRYGISDPRRAVEIVNLRLRMKAAGEEWSPPRRECVRGDGAAAIYAQRDICFDDGFVAARLYHREGLVPGDVVKGPAMITEYTSATVLPPDCVAAVDGYGNLIVTFAEGGRRMNPAADPIELAIFQSAVHSIAEEMGAALRRTALSPNIRERRDYSCALFDGQARVIAMGDHMPVHLGSMPMSVEAAVAAIDFAPGDIAVLNDPYAGGTHLPDITMVLPVFPRGHDKPAFYVANRAHHADVGGTFPGSMGPASEIFQEGLRIPPIRIVRGGTIDREMLDLILLNVRTPAEREGDLESQIGACRVGERRILQLWDKYGETRLLGLIEQLLSYSEALVRAELRAMPSGNFEAEDWLDDDGVTETPRKIAVALQVDPSEGAIHIDFAGSSPQVAGSVNAVRAITLSACFYVLRCLLGGDAPATAGILRPLTLKTPRGSIVDALPPAPVAGGNVETSQRIVDVLLRALADAVPGRVPAASAGTMSNLTIGGRDPRTGQPFTYYETTAGGMGARPGLDGISGVQTHMTNSLNTPIEALEYAYPFRVRRYGYRYGSGGEGQSRGGDGLVREIELLGGAQVALLAERRKFCPYGLQGGEEGRPGRASFAQAGGAESTELPGKFSRLLEAGDILTIESPGGGGWGNLLSERSYTSLQEVAAGDPEKSKGRIMPTPRKSKLLAALNANWQAEMDGYLTYKTLSERETDPGRSKALRGLATAEKHHAELWAARIRELGGPEPVYKGEPTGQAESLASRVGGPDLAFRRLEIDESRDIAKYGKQLTELGDEKSVAILKAVIADEREHFRILGNLVEFGPPIPEMTPDQAKEALEDLLAHRSGGHAAAAGWVGDAVYGINDGLGSIFGIVSGVSGATLGNSHFVLIAGLAGMVASALSMGSGAYLAAKSEREIFEAEFARERESVEYNEAEAREVLSLSYQIRGLPKADAERFVEHLAKNKEQLVQALARERIKTTEEGLSKPLVSAISGAVSTAIGAFIPIVPFFFMSGLRAVVVAAIVSLVAHFAVGASKALITIRSWWSSGLEMTAVGAVEGVVTYFIGIAIGRIGGG